MRFFFSPSIDERDWHVWRPMVKLGEYENRFFFYVDEEDTDQRELIVPPRSLYAKEFLELDYRDPFKLMAFQKKWGPITGLRTRPNTTYDYESHVDVACLGGIGSKSVPMGALNTVFLYDGYGKTDIVAKERFGQEIRNLKDVVNEHWERKCRQDDASGIVPCHIASVQEVAEAVCHAQIAITAITDCLREGFSDEAWGYRKFLVQNSIRYCNASLQSAVLPMDLIEDDDRIGICTTMQYLFICMARGVMRNETYRNCQNPDCRRLFTPAECDRRADSRYCSSECQVKAKHLRTYKPKRKAEAAQILDEQNEIEELVLSWSESNVPVRTLRKGTPDPPTFYSFIGLDCGNPEDEHFIETYDLDIPNPSAQKVRRSFPPEREEEA